MPQVASGATISSSSGAPEPLAGQGQAQPAAPDPTTGLSVAARAVARLDEAGRARATAGSRAASAVVDDPAEASEARSSGRGRTPTMSSQQVALARFSLLLDAVDVATEIIPALLDWLDADSDWSDYRWVWTRSHLAGLLKGERELSARGL